MSAPPVRGDAPVGHVIDGRYRVLRRIGEGGMGVVYEAEHLKLGKRVALKLIAPERIGDPETAARFTREARATAQIEHPHIAAGFDYGLLPEGGAFLVAQLVRGTSLRERIARGPLPWPEACTIAAQIADALSAIHRAGYVHRDLTPENVLVTAHDDGSLHVYVLDFGVAALVASAPREGFPLTALGTIVGTQGYMAPEQALGKTVDARSDLYVVGVLLWEMLAGRPLFSPSASLTDVVTAQLGGEIPVAPPRLLADGSMAGAPFDLERLIRDLLSADLERRPQGAVELRAELLRIVAGRPAQEPTAAAAPGAASPSSPPAVAALAAELTSWASEQRRALRDVLRTRAARIALAIGSALGALLAAVVVAIGMSGPAEAPLSKAPLPPPIAGHAEAPPREATPAITAAIDRMMRSRSHREREASAAEILAASPSAVPPYARAVAGLEIANTCNDRAAQLELVRAIGDPRAAPALERLRDMPRRGCGRGGRSDCYACVRDDAEVILRELRVAGR